MKGKGEYIGISWSGINLVWEVIGKNCKWKVLEMRWYAIGCVCDEMELPLLQEVLSMMVVWEDFVKGSGCIDVNGVDRNDGKNRERKRLYGAAGLGLLSH